MLKNLKALPSWKKKKKKKLHKILANYTYSKHAWILKCLFLFLCRPRFVENWRQKSDVNLTFLKIQLHQCFTFIFRIYYLLTRVINTLKNLCATIFFSGLYCKMFTQLSINKKKGNVTLGHHREGSYCRGWHLSATILIRIFWRKYLHF